MNVDYSAYTIKFVDIFISQEQIADSINAIPVDTVDKIKEIDFSQLTKLREIPENISRFTNLQVIHVDGCHYLASFKNLETLHALTHLYASRCSALGDISAIKGLPLKLLDLSHDLSLKSLEPLESLGESIEELSLKGLPDVSSTRRIVPLMKLHKLDITGTGIKDTSSISFVKKIVI